MLDDKKQFFTIVLSRRSRRPQSCKLVNNCAQLSLEPAFHVFYLPKFILVPTSLSFWPTWQLCSLLLSIAQGKILTLEKFFVLMECLLKSSTLLLLSTTALLILPSASNTDPIIKNLKSEDKPTLNGDVKHPKHLAKVLTEVVDFT